MSSVICEVGANNDLPTKNEKHFVQFVPAKIGYNGPEKIKPYFTEFIKENSDGTYSTALRGRPLTGIARNKEQ